VILLNMGGPDRTASIRPFLDNLFTDREIIRLPGGRPGQRLLGRLIVRARLREVIEYYERIGGASPQYHWTALQAARLQQALVGQGAEVPRVAVAMRYWHPFAEEALRALAAAGVERAVGLTLYPHYTRATTGTSEGDLIAARDRLGLSLPMTFIRSWYDHPGYLDLWARRVSGSLSALDEEVRRRVQLVVSAHGLPQRFIDRGDPYIEHVQATLDGVLARLEDPPPHHLAFQSRTGPVRWIGPGTEEVIRRLAEDGHDALLVWPISFVSDHIETLYEVDMLFREEAAEAGIRHYHVVPQFNDDPTFSDVLADLVTGHLADLPAQAPR
jgi:ferrochelatase